MISIINSPHKCLSQLDGLSWLVSTRSTQEQANESAEFLLLVLNRPFFFQLFFQLFNFQRQAKIHRICRDWTLKRIAYQFTDRGETSKERGDNCSTKSQDFTAVCTVGGTNLPLTIQMSVIFRDFAECKSPLVFNKSLSNLATLLIRRSFKPC